LNLGLCLDTRGIPRVIIDRGFPSIVGGPTLGGRTIIPSVAAMPWFGPTISRAGLVFSGLAYWIGPRGMLGFKVVDPLPNSYPQISLFD
jgi:hypothetical protein